MGSIVTSKAHSRRAIAWVNEGNSFFAIGHQEPWEDEANPPAPSADDEITDIICFKQVEQKCYVVPDELNGTIFYRDHYYRIIAESDVIAEKCRWVFCCTWLNYAETPVGVGYRQVGLYTGTTRKAGVAEGKYVLLPHEVESEGDLEVIINDTVVYRSSSKRERIAAIIEF